MKKYKNNRYSEDFDLESGKRDYEFQLRKPSFWWIWPLILLLLILLCCIRCTHTITVTTVDADSGQPVMVDSVTIDYTAHYLVKDGIFTNEPYRRTEAPDSTGKVVFDDMPCSVFSYVFYAFSQAEHTIQSECYTLDPAPQKGRFHYKSKQTLLVKEKRTPLPLTVIDRETEDPLADASVIYSFVSSGKEVKDSLKTDAAGNCIIPNAPLCGRVKLERVACYAYKDTTNVEILVKEALADEDESIIPLTPLKESFTFFVKDKYTKQPVPEANVEIVLRNKNNVIRHGPVKTNVDGSGRGAFQDAFVAATLELKASKPNYRDGEYSPICTVMEFVAKPDSMRVIYLEPLPENRNFIDADSLSRKPIAGAKNHIVVNSIDGKTYEYDAISNRNGVFTFPALIGDKITIDSSCDPGYKPKHTEIAKFEKTQTIYLQPILVNLDFRTLIGGTTQLLPGCTLQIYDTDGNTYTPTNSGNGEFTVKNVPYNAVMTIVASKNGYEPNDYSVNRQKVSYLMQAPQDKRDIPLMEGLEPCNASASGRTDVNAYSVSAPVSYNMGKTAGSFTMSWDNGGACPDKIDVYNHKPGEAYNTRGPIDTTGMTSGVGSKTIHFSHGSVITIVVTTGPKDGSSWEYSISCPN